MPYHAEVQIENDDFSREWEVIGEPFNTAEAAMQAAEAAYLEMPDAIGAGVSENGVLKQRYGSPGRGAPNKWRRC